MDTLIFWGISLVIHPVHRGYLQNEDREHLALHTLTAIAVVRWVSMLMHRLVMYLGLCSKGLFWHYYMDINNILTVGNICSTGVVLAYLVVDSVGIGNSVEWRTMLACVVFIRWMVLLYKVRAYDHFGLKALPIMQAMYEAGPFSVVVVFYLLGIAHAYYTLGVNPGFQSIMLSFRMGLLGEVDVPDLAGQHTSEGNTPTRHDYIVGALMAFVTFTLTMTLLNIYIGILSLSYERAYPDSWRTLMKVRINIVVRHKAFRVGSRVALRLLRLTPQVDSPKPMRHMWMARAPLASEGAHMPIAPPTVNPIGFEDALPMSAVGSTALLRYSPSPPERRLKQSRSTFSAVTLNTGTTDAKDSVKEAGNVRGAPQRLQGRPSSSVLSMDL
mmetsp:Transcript_7425/g.16160  ORF Transcript_7425/g.16160 Transcript_7425/m.16160 type:complete len:385 (+) Transcript_7425:82-1236(+)